MLIQLEPVVGKSADVLRSPDTSGRQLERSVAAALGYWGLDHWPARLRIRSAGPFWRSQSFFGACLSKSDRRGREDPA